MLILMLNAKVYSISKQCSNSPIVHLQLLATKTLLAYVATHRCRTPTVERIPRIIDHSSNSVILWKASTADSILHADTRGVQLAAWSMHHVVHNKSVQLWVCLGTWNFSAHKLVIAIRRDPVLRGEPQQNMNMRQPWISRKERTELVNMPIPKLPFHSNWFCCMREQRSRLKLQQKRMLLVH